MSLRFDGSAVLMLIAGHPAVFPALKREVDATARKMLIKQLKSTSINLNLILQIFSMLEEPVVRIIFDEMTAKDLATIARRLDPANSDLPSMSEAQLSDHLCALGRGDAIPEPVKKAKVPAKRPKKELSKIGEILKSKVHSGEPLKPTPAKPSGAKKGAGRKA